MSRFHLSRHALPLLCMVLLACKGTSVTESNVIGITVKHPGKGDADLEKQLTVHLNDNANLHAYSMVVDSVICLDVQCEIIPVRLYWDLMGRYWKYALPDGGKLTKTDHVLFTAADYKKLDAILGDRNSLLRDLSSDRIIEPGKAIETADGVSAPTPVSLQHEVVEGASYTTYTLWHWVNGEVVDKIQDLSAKQLTNDQLLELYRSGDPQKIEFALKHFQLRNACSQQLQATITEEMAAHGKAVRASLEFLIDASTNQQSNVYFNAIATAFGNCGKTERIRILESLANCHLAPPSGFYDGISQYLPDLEWYYQIHLMLDLQEQHNADSTIVIQHALTLLDNPNFLIARRAYWFLMDRELDAAQSQALDTFRAAHPNRL